MKIKKKLRMKICLTFLLVCLLHNSYQKSVVKRSNTPDLDVRNILYPKKYYNIDK